MKYLLYIVSILMVSGCRTAAIPSKYEFRGVWVASVKNIDWPSRSGLDVDKQKDEFRKITAYHADAGMNALVVQVRPATDAFYSSEIEPWSQWLTGKQGVAPDPFYDPLNFLIEETHNRGMEFHAWLNPYRAVVDYDSAEVALNHISRIQPSWFVRYGTNLYFDPGVPEAREYLVNVVRDMVSRYDLDAIHFDDYFYPYKIAGEEFPDSVSFFLYGRDFQTRDDWRRDNVNQLIKELHLAIKQEKDWVKFGISPFGVWRNIADDEKGSNTRAGQTNYDYLYADILFWLKNEWIDYVVPQIYWHIGFELAEYTTLVDWWSKNSFGRQLYIGQASYRIGGDRAKEWKNPSEMPNHLRVNSKYPEVDGNIFYNTNSILENRLGFSDSLRNDFYRAPAFTPPMLWIDSVAPEMKEILSVKPLARGNHITWGPILEKGAKVVIYRFKGKKEGSIDNPENIISVVNGVQDFYTDSNINSGKYYTYVITVMDRHNNESIASKPVVIRSSKK
ncbi:MAG: family 10 glycosylhydrolase [Cyclobacteriaceae bacterium]|nr:family 10 glycosylhydrolase [Cyclobacteriaceae bacterium]